MLMNDTFQFPMSFGQQRIWLLDQLSSNKTMYNLTLALNIQGAIDTPALQRAVELIVNQHEILRTNFKLVDNDPVQIIHPHGKVKLIRSQADLEQVKSIINETVNFVFDLKEGALLKINLISKSETEHVLIVAMHHIISDIWSLRLFLEEIIHVYEKIHEDPDYRCKELPLQYADYTIWQREWLGGEKYLKQLAYWKNNLEGIPSYVDMPIDKPRPPVQQYRGSYIRFDIPHSLYENIVSISKQNRVTVFTTMLSAFSLLITQANRQDEIVIGTPIMNRPKKELEKQIGFFLNTLALRINLSGDKNFIQLLKESRETVLSAFSHSDLPFEKLIEEINPQRDLSYSPLFQIMFSMHDEKAHEIRAKDLKIELLEIEQNSSKFDLTLYIEKTGNGAVGSFEYNSELFEKETVENYVSRFKAIISRIAENPSLSVSDIISIPENEKNLISKWNITAIPYEQHETIVSQFVEQVEKTPEAIAVVYRNRSITYQELNESSDRLAKKLVDRKIKSNDIVGLILDRSIEMVVGILGILKSSAAYLPLDPSLPFERLKYMINNSNLDFIAGFEKYAEAIHACGRHFISIDNILYEKDSADKFPTLIDPSSLAYTMYTSGSTGKPKGVMITHKNAVNFFSGMDRTVGKEPGTLLAVTTFTFDISILELVWTLTRGFKVIIQPEIRGNIKPVLKNKLDFSLFYFASVDSNVEKEKYKLLLDGAEYADKNGFTAVWTPERHFHEFGGLYPNPSVVGAAISVKTKNISIRAGSVVFPLHNPIRIAEEWAVVDNLSGGRVGIACASGWHANDFVLFPEHYSNRHEIMYQGLGTVQQLWRGESVSFNDGNGTVKDIKIFPAPIQKDLPIWITSSGNIETFKSAGRLGFNILTHLLGESIEGLSEKITAYRNALKEGGHASDSGKVSIMLHTFIGDNLQEVHNQVREPFINYLKSSIGLVKNMVASMGYNINAEDFTEADMHTVLNSAFSRYIGTAGLIGTIESCTEMLNKLSNAGVNEIACLIDFGLDYDSTMRSLDLITQLKNDYNVKVTDDDYSIPAQIKAHGVTHLQCTPSLATILNADWGAYDSFGSIRKILLGGEKLSLSLTKDIYKKLPQAEIFNMYGPTETTIWSSVSKVTRDAEKIFIGKPISNTAIYILDENLSILPIGTKGEIFIGGDGLAAGYINDEELTRKRFIKNPFGGDRLYKTGDIGRYANNGEIEYLGRNDDQVKVRGHRIELGEIESIINHCDIVRDSAVYIEEHGEVTDIVACVTLAKSVSNNNGSELGGKRLNNFKPFSYQNKELLNQPNGRHLYQLPNGMMIDHYHAHTSNLLFKEIFIDNEYLKNGVTLEEGACVIDAGANIGLFSLMLRSKLIDFSIFAFEPIPPTYERLEMNFKNHRIRGNVYKKGLSNKAETVEFIHYPNMSGLSGRFSNSRDDIMAAKNVARSYLSNSSLEEGIEIDREIEERYTVEKYLCDVTTISDVIKENKLDKIDLLKIDVEKSELLVLEGIAEEDWSKIQQLSLEVDTKEHKDKIIQLLEKRDYSVSVKTLVGVDGNSQNSKELYAFMVYARKKSSNHIGEVENNISTTSDINLADALSLIKKHLKEKLPEYMMPREFKILDNLPLNVNGKIDRAALKNSKSKADNAPQFIYDHHVHSLAEGIISIWKELLQVERIDPKQNFFDLGGHSLLLIKMQSRIKEVLDRDISVIELFRYPTIGTLLDYLGDDKKSKHIYDRAKVRKNRINGSRSVMGKKNR